MTRVSVGLPVFNAAAYLDEALRSLTAQTHADLEIVISDNGSTDATEEICRQHASMDPRVRYLRHEVNRGLAFNHNIVVDEAAGPYFRWYAYDDRLDVQCIARCADVLDSRPDLVLVWPQTLVIDASGEVTSAYRSDLPFDNSSPSSRLRSLLGRRTEETLLHMCYPMYGLMRLDVLRGTHRMGAYQSADTTLLVEMAMRGPWHQIQEPLFHNRRHEASSMINTTPELVATYYDPGAAGVVPTPETRLAWSYVRAVATTRLAPRERMRCLAVVGGWLFRGRQPRIILGEIRIRALQGILRRGIFTSLRGDR
jgi:glycosyltransferase involved in cell wall biosynthesis